MADTSAKRKSDFLGIPHGTAIHRLRKNLMFKLAGLIGLLDCYRCNTAISTVDQFTIEHKVPWEGRSKELFWDLENLAFSHASCNRPHTSGPRLLRKVGPPNTAWCTVCKKFLLTAQFCQSKGRWNSLDSKCKTCKRYKRLLRSKKATPTEGSTNHSESSERQLACMAPHLMT